MKYYENLMLSKVENIEVKETDIQTVCTSLEPHLIAATTYSIHPDQYDSIDLGNILTIPQNKKKEPLPLIGTFIMGDEILLLFVNPEKVLKDSSNYRLIIKKANDFTTKNDVKLNHPKGNILNTLPIWEEIIHRFPDIHKQILLLNPQNPWTLYKKSVLKYKITDTNVVLGGYPQWRINNVDYRKIKELNYLMEYKIDEKNYSIYFFRHAKTQEIITIEQKD